MVMAPISQGGLLNALPAPSPVAGAKAAPMTGLANLAPQWSKLGWPSLEAWERAGSPNVAYSKWIGQRDKSSALAAPQAPVPPTPPSPVAPSMPAPTPPPMATSVQAVPAAMPAAPIRESLMNPLPTPPPVQPTPMQAGASSAIAPSIPPPVPSAPPVSAPLVTAGANAAPAKVSAPPTQVMAPPPSQISPPSLPGGAGMAGPLQQLPADVLNTFIRDYEADIAAGVPEAEAQQRFTNKAQETLTGNVAAVGPLAADYSLTNPLDLLSASNAPFEMAGEALGTLAESAGAPEVAADVLRYAPQIAAPVGRARLLPSALQNPSLKQLAVLSTGAAVGEEVAEQAGAPEGLGAIAGLMTLPGLVKAGAGGLRTAYSSLRPEAITVDDIVEQIGASGNPQEIVDMVRRITPERRMELSLRVGETYGRDAMRDVGGLITRIEQGDATAAQQLQSQWFRDTARLSHRVQEMQSRMPFMGLASDVPPVSRPTLTDDQLRAISKQTGLGLGALRRGDPVQMIEDEIAFTQRAYARAQDDLARLKANPRSGEAYASALEYANKSASGSGRRLTALGRTRSSITGESYVFPGRGDVTQATQPSVGATSPGMQTTTPSPGQVSRPTPSTAPGTQVPGASRPRIDQGDIWGAAPPPRPAGAGARANVSGVGSQGTAPAAPTLPAPRGFFERLGTNIGDIPAALKAITASGDVLGYAQRQGLPALPNYPKAWAGSLNKAWQAYFSDGAARQIAAEMEAKPFFDGGTVTTKGGKTVQVPSFKKAMGIGTDFATPGFEGLDDTFVASIARNVPGFAGSERSMRTGMTSLGLDIYTDLVQDLAKRGVTDAKQYEQVLRHTKHLIGYGHVPDSLRWMSDNFYSARNLTARIQTFTDPLTMTGRARNIAIRDMVRFAGAELASMALLNKMGTASQMWSVEMDPRKSDFGKVRFGDTRLDITGGYGSMYKLTARLADVAEKGAASEFDPREEILTFLKNKTAPIPNLTISYFANQNPNAPWEPFTAESFLTAETATNFLPFAMQDVVVGLMSEEWQKAATLGALGWIGLGTQDYPPGAREVKQEAFEDVSQQIMQQAPNDPDLQRVLMDPTTGETVTDYRNLDSWQRDEIARRFPDFAATVAETGKDSEWRQVGDEKIAETETAVKAFQGTGNADRFKATITNINDKYAEKYARLDAQSDFPDTGSDWQKKVSAFWDEFGAVVDPEDRDHFMEQFRTSLNPAELERFDSMLGSADDPTVQQYKQARQYLSDNYWDPGDEFWARLVESAPTSSPIKGYATYADLKRAVSEHDPLARELQNILGGTMTKAKQAMRYKDPQIDAMLYIWGYSDGVYTKGGMDFVKQWAEANGVSLRAPPILGLR